MNESLEQVAEYLLEKNKELYQRFADSDNQACVLCDRTADSRADNIPVCSVHYFEFLDEWELGQVYRPLWFKLKRAYQNRQQSQERTAVELLQERVRELEAENAALKMANQSLDLLGQVVL